MGTDVQRIDAILAGAAAEGRSALLEHKVYAVLAAAGCRVPRAVLVRVGQAPSAESLRLLGSQRVILKVVSPGIVHKTDVGGVREVENAPASVGPAVTAMLAEVPRRHARELEARPGDAPPAWAGLVGGALERAISLGIRGVLVAEMIPIEGAGPGAETLVAMRHTREFGPVITMGIGGVDTELLAAASRPGLAVVNASASMLDPQGLLAVFRSTLSYQRLAGLTRGGTPLVGDREILRVIEAFRAIGEHFGRDGDDEGEGADEGSEHWTITELEVNPFGACRGELVALDGLLRFRRRSALPASRPHASLAAALHPRSIAVAGVSARGANTGRIILDNVREAGFETARLYVIHPDRAEIDGVPCVRGIADLPERVDLFIVALPAEQVPAVIEELVEHDRAVGVIVIPGGMAEKEGGEVLEGRVRTAVQLARGRRLPMVVNGGNCLGIVSRPGRYNTLFIPRAKLPVRAEGPANVAIVSQSGAFMITRLSRLPWLSPRYSISTGNQVDLTIGDWVRYLADDPEVRSVAVYVEGFRAGDGLAFARAVREIVEDGRDVIFYKAGRTAEGKHATSGHTASIAGDYDVCEAIVRQAGGLVAGTFDEYLGLLRISALAGRRAWRGRRLAAMSNAGYEAVGMADALRGEGWNLELAEIAPPTRTILQAALTKGRAESLVDVRNPLDLTPMADDEVHEDALRAFLADPGVDLVLCSTVPLTAATATLPGEIAAEGSLPNRLARVLPDTDKPIVVSIDSGALYDPMAQAIEERGVPVFRSVDAALRAMGRYAEQKLRH